jgi:cytochrome c oxidase cbb3-type subunit 3
MKNKAKPGATLYKAGIKVILFIVCVLTFSGSISAQAMRSDISTNPVMSNPLFDAMLFVVLLLFVMIIVMADVVKSVAKGAVKKPQIAVKGAGLLLLLLLFNPFSGHAEEAGSTMLKVTTYGGLSSSAFWFMIVCIIFEVIILSVLIIIVRNLLGVEEKALRLATARKLNKEEPSVLERINASVAVEEEDVIMLDHNYDGIRELDNDLPPWWKYGFYVTIVWACIYLIHFHVTKTGSLQLDEYATELKQADVELAEFRKNAVSLVDESKVVQMKDEASISLGKQLFMENCIACHGKSGEGIVGPNLTDEYWLHGGSMNDIFKTIKYGYQEKGMKAWKDDFSAVKIQAIASFIKSLQGSHPLNGKDKQGVLYTEIITSSLDSAKTAPHKPDSLSTQAVK